MEKSPAMLVVSNLDAVAELPPHGVLWSFTRMEEEIGRSVLYKLRTAGLIERHEQGVYQTTSELDRYVEKKHDVTLGFDGQTVLDEFSALSARRSV